MAKNDTTIFRTYMRTHHWIKFRGEYRNLSYNTWILLGEAQSKCEHIAGTPLLPSVAQEMHQLYLAKGVQATTAIEGNTLTEEEVRQRIEGKLKLAPSKEYLGQEIDNILEGCNIIADKVLNGDSTDLTVEDILSYHRLVLRDLPLKEGVLPGVIRNYPVNVGNYVGAPYEDCRYLLEEYCDWLNYRMPLPVPEQSILYGILKAIVAHVHFAWIHPFGDGNGRTARLIEFQILLASGVPSAAAHLLSNHYNQTRTEYYRQLERTSLKEGDLSEFIEYAVQGLVDGLREQLNRVQMQQLIVHWRNYVYSQFRGNESKAMRRRRDLVLALTDRDDWHRPIPMSEIRHVSPRVAEEYAGKTTRTIQRDISELEEMELIIKTREGITANLGLMLAFQPRTRVDLASD